MMEESDIRRRVATIGALLVWGLSLKRDKNQGRKYLSFGRDQVVWDDGGPATVESQLPRKEGIYYHLLKKDFHKAW